MSEGRTILLIDNDDDFLCALTTRLGSVGYRCITAASGSQGLAAFRESNVDLVITDLNMPGGDGVTLAEVIRRTSQVPIIIVTGFRDDFKRRLRDVPNLTTLRKPFETRELMEMVAALLGPDAARAGHADAALEDL